jgi:hypothetical protein
VRRRALAGLLWVLAIACAVVSFRGWDDPCGQNDVAAYAAYAAGALTAAALFVSLRLRLVVSLVTALVLGGLVGGALVFVGLLNWAEHCTA